MAQVFLDGQFITDTALNAPDPDLAFLMDAPVEFFNEQAFFSSGLAAASSAGTAAGGRCPPDEDCEPRDLQESQILPRHVILPPRGDVKGLHDDTFATVLAIMELYYSE